MVRTLREGWSAISFPADAQEAFYEATIPKGRDVKAALEAAAPALRGKLRAVRSVPRERGQVRQHQFVCAACPAGSDCTFVVHVGTTLSNPAEDPNFGKPIYCMVAVALVLALEDANGGLACTVFRQAPSAR
jgi:hypothetical protein